MVFGSWGCVQKSIDDDFGVVVTPPDRVIDHKAAAARRMNHRNPKDRMQPNLLLFLPGHASCNFCGVAIIVYCIIGCPTGRNHECTASTS
eukprot:scaffold3481_cov124-Skeletonema_marinoi.AAC.1